MTPEQARERLREAADVIRRLPPPRKPAEWPRDSVVRLHMRYPALLESTWGLGFEMRVREYGKDFKPVYEVVRERYQVIEGRPSGEEIDRAWEAYEWLSLLDAKSAKMVWAWANGIQLWRLAQQFRRSERQVRYWRDKCMENICEDMKRVDTLSPPSAKYGYARQC